MARPSPIEFFRNSLKSKAYYSDELINVYLLRPIAACVVWLLADTPVTPNQLTVAAIVAGCGAAYAYCLGSAISIVWAGVLVTVKDILDDADGQLARAKELYSRRGRFLDSIGDFGVDVVVFAAITWTVFQSFPDVFTFILGTLAFLGITLRVSYHVFYQVSFLHLEGRYNLNRIAEEITDDDRRGDAITLGLQRIFLLIYGWQDRLMFRIDRWCRGNRVADHNLMSWYSDKIGLRLSGLMGFGTEFAILTTCSLFNSLRLYLIINVGALNAVWLMSVLYRRSILSKNLSV